MASDDLLSSIEIDTSKANKSVDGLNKRLEENNRQTMAIEKELKKLEKEYKSIATALKKLPTEEAAKLAKHTKEATKANERLGKQVQKTAEKVERANKRAAQETFNLKETIVTLGIGAVVLVDRIDTLSSRTANAALQMKKFVNEIGPTVTAAKTLAVEGVQRVSFAVKEFVPTMKALGLAIKEQIGLFRGYQHVAIRTNEAMIKLNNFLFMLGNGANDVKRSFQGMRDANALLNETISRGRTLIRFFTDGFANAGKSIASFRSEWFGTFGASTGGAAQVNRLQMLILSFQAAIENTANVLRNKFGEAMKVAAEGSRLFLRSLVMEIRALGSATVVAAQELGSRLLPAMSQLAKTGLVKTMSMAKVAIENIGPAIAFLSSKVQTLAKAFDARMVASIGASVNAVIGLSSGAVTLAQKLGVLEKGIITVIETGHVLGLTFLGLGTIMKQSENSVISFIGTVMQLVGILSLSLTAALTIAIGAIGQFMVMVGDKLIKVMDKWEEKFVKQQQITRAFEFTIIGFNRAIGEHVGTLDFWSKQVDELAQNTAFGAAEVQKSIKILVAEGQALGLTAEQSANILKRSADIAAATGLQLSDVSLRVAKAMIGNGSAMESLGIFTDKATLENSKFVKSQKLVIDNLDKQQKAIVVMNSIFDQSIPLIGAAADQLNTVAGAETQLAAATTDLQAKLGSQNIIFTKLTNLQAQVVRGFASLPTPVLDMISIFIDVAGVTLKVVGTMVTFLITIVSIKHLLAGLNALLKSSMAAQAAFNIVLGLAAKRLDIQIVAVTSLKTALTAMNQVLVAGTISAFKQMGASILAANARMLLFLRTTFLTVAGLKGLAASLLAATAATVRFTAAILLNPLFIKASLIVGGIYVVVRAFRELSDELEQLKPAISESGKAAKDSAGFLRQLGDAAKMAFRLAVDGAKILIAMLLNAVRVVQFAVAGWKKLAAAVTGNKKAMQDAHKEGLRAVEQMEELAGVVSSSSESIVGLFNNTAIAAGKAAGAIDKAKESAKGFSDALRLTGEQTAGMSTMVLGTEFEQALERRKAAILELNKLRDQGGKDEDISKAQVQAEQTRLELIKLRRDAVKNLGDMEAQIRVASLAGADQEIAKVNQAADIQIQALKELEKGLRQTGGIRDEELRQIRESINLIEQVRAADIAAVHKEVLDDLKAQNEQLSQQNQLIGLDQVTSLKKTLEFEMKKLDAKREQLKKEGLLTQEAEEQLKIQRKLLEEGAGKQIEEAQKQNQLSQENKIPRLFSKDDLGLLEQTLGNGAASIAASASSMLQGPMAAVAAANMIADAVQGLIDAIPNLLNKVANIFNSLTELPLKIAEGVQNVVQSVVRFAAEFIPNLFKSVGDILESVIVGLMIELPNAIANTIATIPDMFVKLLDRLPEFITKFVQGFITNIPKLTIALVVGIIKLFTRAIPALIKLLVVEIPQAIIEGIIQAFVEIGDLLAQLMAGNLDLEFGVDEKSLQSVQDKFTEVSDQLFSVIDLEAEARAFDKAKQLEKVIDRATSRFMVVMQAIIDAFVAAWHMVLALFEAAWALGVALWKTTIDFFKATWDIIVAVFRGAWEVGVALFQGVINVFKAVWETVIGLFQGVINFFVSIWHTLMDLFQGKIDIFEAVGEIFDAVFKLAADSFKTVFNGAQKIFAAITEALGNSWEAIKRVFASIGETLTNLFGKIGENLSGVFEPIKKVFDKFANLLDKVFGPLVSELKGAFSGALDFFKNPGDVFNNLGSRIWSGLKANLDGIGDFFHNVFTKLNPGNLFDKIFRIDFKGKGPVEKALGIDVPFANFARGGFVPGQAAVPGDSVVNDKIIAAVSPDEAIIPRSITQDPRMRPFVEALLDGSVERMIALFGGIKVNVPKISAPKPPKIINDAVNAAKQVGGDISKGAKHAGGVISNASKGAMGALEHLDPTKLWKIVEDQFFQNFMKVFEHNKFHNGGLVGNDVPATLERGEFVFKRQAVNAFGTGLLERMNNGQAPVGQAIQVEQTINIQIDAGDQRMDEGFIRSRLIPTVKKELKNATLRGELIISKRGVFS